MTLVRSFLVVLVLASVARAQIDAPFDTVAWKRLCAATEPDALVSPKWADLVGNAMYPSSYFAFDANFLYLRYRVNGDPRGAGNFANAAWSVLVQVPGGNGFQYQYQLVVNGTPRAAHDPIEIWQNTAAADIVFNPLFQDDADTRLFAREHDTSGLLARTKPTSDGSRFGRDEDWFVDVAFPVGDLIASGVIADASELGGLLFFPVTGSAPRTHDLDHVSCLSLLPSTTLALEKSVAPASVPPRAMTPVTYTITVRNQGASVASGLVVRDAALPASFANVVVTTSGANAVVVSSNPLEVRADRLEPGGALTIRIDARVTPACGDPDVTGEATVSSLSAPDASASTTLDVLGTSDPEVCDGVDNDCDGDVDEGGAALCDDGDPCTGAEACGGVDGCQPGTPPTCGDGNACTIDSCEAGVGCHNEQIPGCRGCTDAGQCDDGSGCTTDTCDAGKCVNTAIPECRACTGPAQCSDGNGCTDDVCTASGVCENPPRSDCTRCTRTAECDDGNACTTDECLAEGRCASSPIAGCRRCETAAECDDGDACTTDTCAVGACASNPIPGCGECVPSAERCDDGADQDCDGLVDCADPDCAASAPCVPVRAEDCGNCVDDDRDGFVDWEDDDCCRQPRPLVLDRLLLTPGTTRVRGDHLRVQAEYAAATPALFDPLRRDTSLVLTDASGPLLCTTLPAGRWRRARGVSFRYTDKAGSVQLGRFSINRRGRLLFSARSRSVSLRAVDGAAVRVTVRAGDECTQSTATVRPKKSGLVYP